VIYSIYAFDVCTRYREHQDIAASWSRIIATVKGLTLFVQVLL